MAKFVSLDFNKVTTCWGGGGGCFGLAGYDKIRGPDPNPTRLLGMAIERNLF
jgi:hypothetical protein